MILTIVIVGVVFLGIIVTECICDGEAFRGTGKKS